MEQSRRNHVPDNTMDKSRQARWNLLGLVSRIFLDLVCHFENCKLEKIYEALAVPTMFKTIPAALSGSKVSMDHSNCLPNSLCS